METSKWDEAPGNQPDLEMAGPWAHDFAGTAVLGQTLGQQGADDGPSTI